jgi:DNA-binding transcriptional ArsR family regulator
MPIISILDRTARLAPVVEYEEKGQHERADEFERCSNLLTAMSNPVRLKILTMLRTRELSVGALVELTGLSQSALSQHLAKLRRYKLVSTRRQAQTVFYSGRSPKVALVLDALNLVFKLDGHV